MECWPKNTRQVLHITPNSITCNNKTKQLIYFAHNKIGQIPKKALKARTLLVPYFISSKSHISFHIFTSLKSQIRTCLRIVSHNLCVSCDNHDGVLKCSSINKHQQFGGEKHLGKVEMHFCKRAQNRDPWVAQRFGACLWPRARSWRPWIESHVGLPVHGACFSLCLCLCLSLSLSLSVWLS